MKSAISEILEAPERGFMTRALELADRPETIVLPNPRVGAVITRLNKIVGEGFHEGPGQPHAEVMAIRDAESKGIKDFSDCDLYVTLEPCSHLKKRTPPCAPLIIQKNFARVVVSSKDPNPLVAGRGIESLQNSGIEVQTGLCESEALNLNQDFFKNQTQRLPYVTLKVATTFDGRLADDFGESQWITGSTSRKYVHQLRARADAVAVGAKTFDRDDPQLNARLENSTHAKKIVIFGAAERGWRDSKAQIANGDNALIALDSTKPLSTHLRDLYEKHEVRHLFVEGGKQIASKFLSEELVDEMILFFGRGFVGGRGEFGLLGSSFASSISSTLAFHPHEVRLLDGDVMCRGRFHVYGID